VAERIKTAAYWQEDENLAVLTGLAAQCRTLNELAGILGVYPSTVRKWRTLHTAIKKAIDVGREYADAGIVHSTYRDAVLADGPSRRLWWKYRIGRKESALAAKLYGPQELSVDVEDARAKLIARLDTGGPAED